jgi:hypothetical protein
MGSPTFRERYEAFARFNPQHVQRRLTTFAHNLAIAGGLCAAFGQGWAYGAWWEAAHPGDEPEFKPGHSIPRGPQGGE